MNKAINWPYFLVRNQSGQKRMRLCMRFTENTKKMTKWQKWRKCARFEALCPRQASFDYGVSVFDHKQRPTGRVFFSIGSGIEKKVGWRAGSVQVGVLKYSIGYFRVSYLLSGISGYFRVFRVYLGISGYFRILFLFFMSGYTRYFRYTQNIGYAQFLVYPKYPIISIAKPCS